MTIRYSQKALKLVSASTYATLRLIETRSELVANGCDFLILTFERDAYSDYGTVAAMGEDGPRRFEAFVMRKGTPREAVFEPLAKKRVYTRVS
jgi:hypothetical protein